jgi:type I restriction enzyme, R subunit
MASDELDKVELPALEQLQSLRWAYLEGSQLSPDESDERSSYKDVVLEHRLEKAINRINPWISEDNLRRVISEFTRAQFPNLIEANQSVWNTLTQYTSIRQDVGKGNKDQTVKFIDFDNLENNEFLCTNQFKVSGVNQNIIPDIILFVNGLPLAVIECKSPYITNPMESGIDQLMRYANRRNKQDNEGAEKLFHYNQLMVSTHRDKARVGTITSRMEHFLEWKDPYPLEVDEVGDNPQSQDVLIAGMFDRTNFLDLIQNFTVFEPVDGRTVKKIARYQQFRAVHKSIERIKSGIDRKSKSGVIWHTQGSGKSLTMVFLTLKVRRDPELQQNKLVFITDRIQLYEQLTSTFQNAQNETVYPAESVQGLKELLQKDASDIVMTTVQKFQETADETEFPVLNESEKIIVLADEAHRTQYGTLGAAVNVGLPNASKIAFTGTPLIRSEKTTNEFGSYIDTYTIEQSVEDGATVQILYEGREARVNVTGDSLDGLFDEYFGDRTEEEQAAIKRRYGNTRAVLEAPQRIRRVCIDILKHYREYIYPNGFKAMIVTSSRYAAITYKEMMDELEAPESAIIISGDHNDDKRYWQYTDSTKHKTQIENYKKPIGSGEGQSNLSILIVKDMLLTGFDAPIAQVMYLDRKLTDHTLLQAIARVNRTNKNKNRGYIVDYYGLSDYLTEALDMFSSDEVEGALRDLKDEIPKLQNAHTRVMQHFVDMDLDDLDTCILSLEDETKRQMFQLDFQKFSQQMDIVLPDEAATPFIPDLRRLGKISHGARNLFRDEQLSIADAGEKVRKLIEDHIYSTGVDPKIPPVDLLAADFQEKLDEHKTDRTKASEIENAIKHHIKIKLEDDPEYYKSLSEKLESIIRKNEEHWDELVQLLMDFRGTIEEEREARAEELGLTETEYAFHGILMAEITKGEGVEAIDEDTHLKIKSVVQQLVAMMDEATEIVGFFQKWDEQRRVRRNIKRAIIEEFDDLDLVKSVTDRFMELAEVKFR